MDLRLRIPFTKLNFGAWKRLIITAICAFYLVHIVYGIIQNNFLPDFGGDYLAFWSAGKIADEKGYAYIYNTTDQTAMQMAELEIYNALSGASLRPAAILPVFVIPFQFLSKLSSRSGFQLWTVINLAALVGYLLYFHRKSGGENQASPLTKSIIFLMLISFPVFTNFIQGQVKVLLLICVGEFIRAAYSRKPMLAGAWLGGLLLNPQLLILVIPAFFILRNWKVIYGFIISSTVLLSGSLLLSGLDGLRSMVTMWAKNMPLMSPQTMVNWRMLGLQINYYFDSSSGWIITWAGVLVTLTLCIIILKDSPKFGSTHWMMVMCGILAASCAVTWHSNIPMAMVLIPFLIYLSGKKLISERQLFFWVFLTPLVFMVEYIIGFMILLGILPDTLIFTSLTGVSGLTLNIFLTVLAFRTKKTYHADLIEIPA